MQTFTDNAGRVWSVAINVNAIKQVKALAGVDLLETVGGKLLERLVSDPVTLCDVLYALCKSEADAKGLTDEDFGRSMGGDAIDGATTALLEELVSFFPSRRRTILQKALSKLRTLESKILTAAEARIDSPEIDKAIEKMLAEGPTPQNIPAGEPRSGASSTTLPGS